MASSDKLLNALDHHWPEGVIEFDHQGLITHVNNRTIQLLGWSESELLGLPIHKALCSLSIHTDHDETNCPLKQFEHSRSPPTEVNWVHKNQTNIAVRYRQQLFQPEASKLGGFIIFQTCENLGFNLGELQKLAKFTDINPAPLLEVDAQGLILFSNPAMTDLMLEFSFDDNGSPSVLPENLPDLVKESLDKNSTLNNIETSAINPEAEYSDTPEAFPTKYFLWTCHPIKSDHSASVLLCGIDISSKKELDIQQAQFQQELAQEKLKTRKEYLAKMVHELRSPLNLVVGYANILKRKLREHCSEMQLSLFDQIINGGMQLADQISTTLEVSRVESGLINAEFTEYQLNGDMVAVAASMETVANEKCLALVVDIQQAPLMMCADKQQIKQIAINLLSNALKYTDSGSVTLNVKEIDDTQLGKAVSISVTDTGCGIPESEQESIFQLYQRQKTHEQGIVEGDGYGLAICVEMAALHRGRITLESKLNVGSTFTAILPLL